VGYDSNKKLDKKSFLYYKKVIINETDGINDLKDRKEKNEEKIYP